MTNLYPRTTIVLAAVVLMIALLASGGCASSGSGAKVAADVQDWSQGGFSGRKITTDHFVIYSTLIDRELEAVLPEFMEACYERYESTFRTPPAEPIRLTTYIFGNRQEWQRYIREHHPARSSVYQRILSGGFTEGTLSASFFTARSTALSCLAHEGFHQYLHARCPDAVPAWLNEGLACYHEAYSYASGKPEFTPRENTFRIGHLRDALQRKELLPLREIVATDAGQVISHRNSIVTQTYYAQAWALVTYLRHGGGGRYARAFDRMLKDIADGTIRIKASAARLTASARPDTSFGEAVFASYFGVAPNEIEDEYYNHLVKACGF
ncbi:MAG: DUF1570 domain-containing protein [Phycisphaerales bacterium]|nr:MAG: DUF1570 domain-containing protein [Phycisphaerales bacterium]